MKIAELIVVEGKDDVAAVKRAVEADVISTGGFGITSSVIDTIKAAAQRTGVIILTDPDTAGNSIRRRLNQWVPGCKNAYIAQKDGVKGNDIGVENASPEVIVQALQAVKPKKVSSQSLFSLTDLTAYGLAAGHASGLLRKKVGIILGIGEANAKQFLLRLNNQGISREELLAAVSSVKED